MTIKFEDHAYSTDRDAGFRTSVEMTDYFKFGMCAKLNKYIFEITLNFRYDLYFQILGA